MPVAALLVLDGFRAGHHVERLRGIFGERAFQPVVDDFQRLGSFFGILGFREHVHHFREIFVRALEMKDEVGFGLVEEFAPRAGVKRRALHEGGFDGLGEKVPLEYADVLDPGTVLGHHRIAFVELLEAGLVETDKFQLEEREVLAADGAEFALKFGAFGLDGLVGQVRTFT